MSNATRHAVIEGHCRELKLPRVLREYQALGRQARNDAWDYEDFLLNNLEIEVHGRRQPSVPMIVRHSLPEKLM